eukprot:TRINITY_DN25058_c0_g1_i1.p1 TRINITY_DN25058_c0_g1~~TRINITY_DN25058_c0_g1_i1.p1  ORF type:complete len:326 (+),score=54.20 TRINITY_DN25058_c0_g1_i1:38-979(+)
MSGTDVQRTTGLITELLRKIAVPPVATEEGASRIIQMHRLICRKLEPQLRQAVSVLQQMEGLEGDRAMFLSKGENKRANEVTNVIHKLMDSVEHEYYQTRDKDKSGIVNHENGFCSAVSGTSPAKRCLPTSSRTKTPDYSTPKVVKTRTGLTTTPPASSSRRGRDDRTERDMDTSRDYSERSRSKGKRRSTRSSSPTPLPTPTKVYVPMPISPMRPMTPVHQITMAPSTPAPLSEASPRRDREFIVALLRSLQLENYAHLFTDMTLLSFYRLSYEQLTGMGLNASSAKTLYNSIDQIKQIADTQVHSPGRSLT